MTLGARLHRITALQAAVALAVISAAYYGLYLTSGYNTADDGNYAQTAYELLLGRSPKDMALSYGLLWFQAGEGLFRLFGVHFILVRMIFFTVITLTSLLLFYTLVLVSGSVLFAFALAAVVLFVPAFPATAFYGFCVLLNASAQMRLAVRLEHGSKWDGVLAGAALGLSFQIRSDFGFIFAVPLGLLILLMAWQKTWGARRVLAGALLAFIVVTIPAVVLAAAGGYESVLSRQYFEYLTTLRDLLLNGLRGLGDSHTPGAAKPLALLARPGADDPALAALVYLPLVAFAAYGVFAIATLRRRIRLAQASVFAQSAVAAAAGIATFPHYFFFRPDLTHIANFMPGFILMAGAFTVQLRRDLAAAAPTWAKAAAAGVVAVMILDAAIYVWTGLPSPSTGAIGVAFGEHERFRAENGVDVLLDPAQKAQMETIRDAVLAHSAPGDAIVCVPYCPGMAFMTARRMLFTYFYVDDTFLILRRDWLPSAIAQTKATPPAVVIVQDWAVNGTEWSKFANWAAPYMDVVNTMAQERLAAPGVTIYVMSDKPAS